MKNRVIIIIALSLLYGCQIYHETFVVDTIKYTRYDPSGNELYPFQTGVNYEIDSAFVGTYIGECIENHEAPYGDGSPCYQLQLLPDCSFRLQAFSFNFIGHWALNESKTTMFLSIVGVSNLSFVACSPSLCWQHFRASMPIILEIDDINTLREKYFTLHRTPDL